MKQLAGIYVPGLGDFQTRGEDRLGKLWKAWYGIDLQYHPVRWREGKHFQPKLTDLLKHIDRLYKQHGPIALVGSSAGASAVLNAYAKDPTKIRAVVVICGKILHPETISTAFQTENPAFMESFGQLPDNLAKLTPKELDRVLSVQPLYDQTVPVADMVIKGAHHRRQHTVHHSISIGIGLTLASRPLARFIRNQS